MKSRKALGLLSYLAVNADKPVARDHLAGLLWGESNNTQARANLRQALTQVRSLFRASELDPISSTHRAVTLNSHGVSIDTRPLLEGATQTTFEFGRQDQEFMEGFNLDEPDFEQWLTTQREGIRMALLRLHQEAADALFQAHRLEESIVHLTRALALDPLQEHIHRRLMRCFLAQGRHDAALAQFDRCRSILLKELEIEPESETLRLHESIRDRRNEPAAYSGEPVIELPDRPSVAVLPFVDLDRDPGQEYFSDGLSEDIATELSRQPELFVIASHSTMIYKERRDEPRQIARELGVQYIFVGSIRKIGHRVRITAQLLDGETSAQLWAERYDRELGDIFELQDEMALQIASALLPKLSDRSPRSDTRPTRNLEAYDHFLRGRKLALEDTKESNSQAQVHLQASIKLDPEFALAFAHLSRSHVNSYVNRWSNEPADSLRKAVHLGNKAVELNGSSAFAHFASSAAACWNKELNKAESEAKTAIAIEPSFADGCAVLGMVRLYKGHPEEALGFLAKAMRLDPHYRDIYLHLLALAFFHLHRYQDAVSALNRRLIRKPESDISRALLAAAYGHLGNHEDARREWAELRSINPTYSIEHKRAILPYQNPQDFEHIVDGLARAGLPE